MRDAIGRLVAACRALVPGGRRVSAGGDGRTDGTRADGRRADGRRAVGPEDEDRAGPEAPHDLPPRNSAGMKEEGR